MWKKDEGEAPKPAAASTGRSEASSTRRDGSVRATIGPSITIRGDVTGSEDLLIQGHVDGSVTLELHEVTVGSDGHVKADITGRVITIEGKVEGDLKAQEQIILRATAHVSGDLRAPRLVLEDGATFRGLVDMSGAKEKSPAVVTSGNGAAGAKTEKASGTRQDPANAPKRAAI